MRLCQIFVIVILIAHQFISILDLVCLESQRSRVPVHSYCDFLKLKTVVSENVRPICYLMVKTNRLLDHV